MKQKAIVLCILFLLLGAVSLSAYENMQPAIKLIVNAKAHQKWGIDFAMGDWGVRSWLDEVAINFEIKAKKNMESEDFGEDIWGWIKLENVPFQLKLTEAGFEAEERDLGDWEARIKLFQKYWIGIAGQDIQIDPEAVMQSVFSEDSAVLGVIGSYTDNVSGDGYYTGPTNKSGVLAFGADDFMDIGLTFDINLGFQYYYKDEADSLGTNITRNKSLKRGVSYATELEWKPKIEQIKNLTLGGGFQGGFNFESTPLLWTMYALYDIVVSEGMVIQPFVAYDQALPHDGSSFLKPAFEIVGGAFFKTSGLDRYEGLQAFPNITYQGKIYAGYSLAVGYSRHFAEVADSDGNKQPNTPQDSISLSIAANDRDIDLIPYTNLQAIFEIKDLLRTEKKTSDGKWINEDDKALDWGLGLYADLTLLEEMDIPITPWLRLMSNNGFETIDFKLGANAGWWTGVEFRLLYEINNLKNLFDADALQGSYVNGKLSAQDVGKRGVLTFETIITF